MAGPTALDSFLDKWRSRWPEWAVAEVFVPVRQRERAVAWFALLQEFDDILNIAGDPLPADAKLGWWGTELRDWARRFQSAISSPSRAGLVRSLSMRTVAALR